MNALKKGFTIRWKIVLIYCLLVFIATVIIGVFNMRQLENYYINSVRVNLENTVRGGTLLSSLSAYEDLKEHQAEIQTNINEWYKAIQEEIFVVDRNVEIIASNTDAASSGQSAVPLSDKGVILKALSGTIAESSGLISDQDREIPVMNLAFPIGEEDHITGVIYIRANLSVIFDTINQSKRIFINAMLIAIFITIILGSLISKTITTPIQEVTQKAARMAHGDFDHEVTVKGSDEIGQLAQMFNMLRTQLSSTLTQISNEKSKLETILRYMADGLIAVDLSGHIIHANQAAMRILKIGDADLSNPLYDPIIKSLRDDLVFNKLMEKCEEGAMAETFTSSGSTYAVRYDRFKGESGGDIGIIMILQDITERQKMENMQTDFVANVSHELKTPLTTIKSYTETLIDGALENKDMAIEFLSIIDMEADRMNRLVKELLQLSRLDNNQEKWFKKETNLISILKTSVTKVELTAKAKQQHLNCIFNPDDSIRATIDKDGIEQVILNILSNAIKYTKEGGRIDIDAFINDKKAQIVVMDNGIGIPESEISRVFERFFRVDKARSRSMGGTGLGLAISKQIIEDHDGGIQMESREGKGTKVTVTLPVAPIRGEKGIE